MTDKVSYNLPSWNPFAAAAESNIYKSRSEIKEEPEDEEPIDKTSNEFLVTGLEALDHVNPKTVDRDYLQDVLTCDKLNIILERFQKAADKRKITWRKQPATIISADSTNTIDIIRDDPTNPIDKHDNGKKKLGVESAPSKGKQSKATTSYRKNDTEEQITLEPMPDDKRDKDKEKILAKQIDQHIDDWQKLKSNVVDKGYLHPPLADKMIIAFDSMHKWMLPLVNDKWTQGKWINAYPQYVAAFITSHNLWETPQFIRWRYKVLKNGTIHNEVPYRKNHLIGTILEKKFNIAAQIADNQPFDLYKLIWENDEQTRHQQILKREVGKSRLRTIYKRKKKVFKMTEYTTNPEDYDPELEKLGYHNDMETSPIVPPHFRNKEEYTIAQEPYKEGLVRKDSPEDYTEYSQKLNEYGKYKYKEDMKGFMNEIDQQIEALKQYRNEMKERYGV